MICCVCVCVCVSQRSRVVTVAIPGSHFALLEKFLEK